MAWSGARNWLQGGSCVAGHLRRAGSTRCPKGLVQPMPDPLNDDQFIQRRMLLAAVLSASVMGAYVFLAPRP